MKSSKIPKLITTIFLLILSPLAIAAITSVIYIVIQLANGKNLTEGIVAIQEIIKTLSPFLPYITGIPAALVILAIGLKNRSKIISRLRK